MDMHVWLAYVVTAIVFSLVSGSGTVNSIIDGLTTVTIDAIVMLGYTSLAAQMGRFIRSERIMSKINKVFGSMFMGCGALLAAAKA